MKLELMSADGVKIVIQSEADHTSLLEWIERTIRLLEEHGGWDPAHRNSEYIELLLAEARLGVVNMTNRNFPGWNVEERQMPVWALWVALDSMNDHSRRRNHFDITRRVVYCLLDVCDTLVRHGTVCDETFVDAVFQGYV